MNSSFGPLLAHLLDQAGFSQVVFAARVDTAQSFVSQVIREVRTPPLDRLDVWADALGLKGGVREEFLFLAAMKHIRDETLRATISKRFRDQGRIIDDLEARLARLEKKSTRPRR